MLEASAIINIHREGALLVPTLRSLALAKKRAIDAGFTLEVLVVADNANAETLAIAKDFDDLIDRIVPASFGDLGASREFGISEAAHDWVFLHDGDDLFSSNWYLQFFEMAKRGEIDERTVYHTALFSRFGNEQNIRQMIDSWDTRFHPLFLASEWYYSNKCVVNRKLFAETPMPYNNKFTGIGNEDWTWSCHTIHKEIRHTYLPETICFYRVKPAITSLGLTPGMIHGPSKLFEPDSLLQIEIRRAERADKPLAFCDTLSKKGEPVQGDGPPPDWFWDEVDIQGEFESIITDYRAVPFGQLRAELPNLHYNVASATQYMMRDMDERPKIFIFASAKNLRAADKTIELMLSAARDYNDQSHQPVLVLDEDDLVVSDFGLMGRFGAKVIGAQHVERFFKIEEWYYNRLMMRPMVQYNGGILIDLGSNIFNKLFTEFHRVLLENFEHTVSILPDASLDPLSPTLNNVARNANFAAVHAGKPYRIFARKQLLSVLSKTSDWSLAGVPDDMENAINSMTRLRFRDVNGSASFSLADMLGAPRVALRNRLPMNLQAGQRLNARVISDHEVALSAVTHGKTKFYLYQSSNTWVSPDWYKEAHEFLSNNNHIWLVPPQISMSLQKGGRYRSRWHNYATPQTVFSSWYDQLLTDETPPMLVLTRERISKKTPETPAALAEALFTYCQQQGKLASACNETVAIAMPAGGQA